MCVTTRLFFQCEPCWISVKRCGSRKRNIWAGYSIARSCVVQHRQICLGTRDFAHAHCDSESAVRGPPDGPHTRTGSSSLRLETSVTIAMYFCRMSYAPIPQCNPLHCTDDDRGSRVRTVGCTVTIARVACHFRSSHRSIRPYDITYDHRGRKSLYIS